MGTNAWCTMAHDAHYLVLDIANTRHRGAWLSSRIVSSVTSSTQFMDTLASTALG